MVRRSHRSLSVTDRDPKWVEVEPLQTIPAFQPILTEWSGHACGVLREETIYDRELTTSGYYPQYPMEAMFIDSTWKPPAPPLELPTEMTWGIIVDSQITVRAGAWRPAPDSETHPDTLYDGNKGEWVKNTNVLDFIPLTQDQIDRINGERYK
jgi:hypothetical protein